MEYRTPKNLESYYPLSSNQKSLWFVYQLSPNSAAYNVYTAAAINGNLDLASWEASWKNVVNKHSILRTTYHQLHNGEPIQICREVPEIELKVIETYQSSEKEIHEKLIQETRLPFNLEQGPLIRVCLLQKDADASIQLVVIHEIAGELRSLEILLCDFFEFYYQTRNHH